MADVHQVQRQRYCRRCSRPLPKGRASYCYHCRPFRGAGAPSPEPEPAKEYTPAELGARAEARGIDYGEMVYLIENGLSLPPLQKSVVWPWDSKHKGEEQA